MRIYIHLPIIVLSYFYLMQQCFAGFSFTNPHSTVNVDFGRFIVNTPITNWNGTLIHKGTVAGAPITFNEGILQTNTTPVLLTGSYDGDASTQIVLSQNQSMRIDSGQFSKKILVQSSGNRLEGQPFFTQTSAVRLANPSSSLTLALNSALNSSVAMNGGQLILDGDFKFADDRNLTGSGNVNVNGRRFIFGAPLNGASLNTTHTIRWTNASDVSLSGPMSLSGTWTFDGGMPLLQGNGYTLDLTQRGSIYVKKNTTLRLADIKIKGFGRGGFVMEDRTSQVRLSRAEIEMANSYTVTSGGMYVDGISTIVTKNGLLTFDLRGSLTVDGVTLWYDPVNTPDLFNIRPLIANPINSGGNKYVTYLNSGIIRGPADSSLAKANSNALLACCRHNSNTLLYLNRTSSNAFARGIRNNSNALLACCRHNSNALLECCGNNSNAIINILNPNNTNSLASQIRYVSNTVLFFERTDSAAKLFLTKNNSNALLFCCRNNSNALLACCRHNSNALLECCGNNSNAIINILNPNNTNSLASQIRYVSNTVLFFERTDSAAKLFLTKNNSNALLFCCRNNSNALLACCRHNSNALLECCGNNSNAIINILNPNNTNSLASQIRYVSNTVLFFERTDSAAKLFLTKNNSNALLFCCRNNSNALLACCRHNSNALLECCGNNSNAIINILNPNNTNSLASQIRYVSNTVLFFERTDSAAKLFLTKNNSNALLFCCRNNSNALLACCRHNSNALLECCGNNSNAIINILNPNNTNSLASQIRYVSNTVLFFERTDSAAKLFLTKNNSNALLFCCRNNSNALLACCRHNSNALLECCGNNSNAIINILNPNNTNSLASQIRYVSNTVLFFERTDSAAKLFLTKNNSNALLFCCRNNSNALLACCRHNSNALLDCCKNLSNALLACCSNTNVVGEGCCCCELTTGFPLVSDITMTKNCEVCPLEFIEIGDSITIDGQGAQVRFSNPDNPQFIVAPGVTVLLKNITFRHISNATFDLGAGSTVQIGENVIWGLETDVTLASNGHIQVVDGPGGCNIFTIRGEICRQMLNIKPLQDQLNNGNANQTFLLGHNTILLQNAAISGLDHIQFAQDDACAPAIALSCNAAVDVDSNFPDGNGILGTALNFFVEGDNNTLILRKDGLHLFGNITFGDLPDNQLMVEFNLATFQTPGERVGVLPDFPYVVLDGDPGIFLFSELGIAELDFIDFNSTVRNANTNAMVVDDNSLLMYKRLQILDNPIKQQSSRFRFEGIELFGERIDPSFIRLARSPRKLVTMTAIHMQRMQERLLAELAKEQIRQEMDIDISKTVVAQHEAVALTQNNDTDNDEHFAVERALNLPESFDQIYVDQIINLGNPVIGNIDYNRVQLNNFTIDPEQPCNIRIQNGTVVTLGANVVLDATHIINVQDDGNIIRLPFAMTIGQGNFLLAPGAEITFEFTAEGPPNGSLTIQNNTTLDIEAGAIVRFSGPGTATIGNNVVLNCKGVKTVHPVTKVETVSSRGHVIVTNDATLTMASNAFARVLGVGEFEVCDKGEILFNTPGTLAFGPDQATIATAVCAMVPNDEFHDFIFTVENSGVVRLGHTIPGGQRARISFRHATSMINVNAGGMVLLENNGTFEVNADGTTRRPARLKSLSFLGGNLSIYDSGIFALGSNRLNLGAGTAIPATGKPFTFEYDGRSSTMNGDGSVQFVDPTGFIASLLPNAAAFTSVQQQQAEALIKALSSTP